MKKYLEIYSKKNVLKRYLYPKQQILKYVSVVLARGTGKYFLSFICKFPMDNTFKGT